MIELSQSTLYKQLRLIYGEDSLHTTQVKEMMNRGDYLYYPVYHQTEVVGWIGVIKELVSDDAQRLISFISQGESSTEELPFKGMEAEQKRLWQRIIRQPLQQWLPLWSAGREKAARNYRNVYIFIDIRDAEWVELYTTLCEVFEGIVEEDVTFLLPLDKHQYVWVIPEHQTNVVIEKKLLDDLHDTLASDLLIKARFVLSECYQMPCDLKSVIEEDIEKIYCALEFGVSRPILSMRDLDPYILLSKWSRDELAQFIDRTLGPVQKDDELLLTISTYFKENLNISETAKKLYIHRNSLQYRLEKFRERTGMDLRSYEQAMNVYLAILAIGKLYKEHD